MPFEDHDTRLHAERRGTLEVIAQLERDFDAIVEASRAVATDDEHDPDGATIGFERAKVDAMLGQARATLVELDLALERVRTGTYGICDACGRPIGEERLAALPSTTTCVECAAGRRHRRL